MRASKVGLAIALWGSVQRRRIRAGDEIYSYPAIKRGDKTMNFASEDVMETAGEQPQTNLVMGLVGAAGGALLMGIVYGFVSLFIGEIKLVVLLVGAVSGFGAMKLGKGSSLVVGIAAAILTLIGIFIGKVIIGAPVGFTWVEYHTTMFDILFCYLGAPIVAFGVAYGSKLQSLRRHLPF